MLWTLLFRVGNLRLGLGSVSLMVFKGGSFKDCSGFGPFSRFIADLGCWIITSSFCGTFKIIPTSISRIVPDHRYWQFHYVHNCHFGFKIKDGQFLTHFKVKNSLLYLEIALWKISFGLWNYPWAESLSLNVDDCSKSSFRFPSSPSSEFCDEMVELLSSVSISLSLWSLVVKCLLFKKGQNVEVQVFFTINKKSTFFVQFCSNFQGLTRPWIDQSLKVWAKLDKNCRFFINGEKNLHFYILTFLKQQTF